MDAFERLEELVSAPAKKKRISKPLTPEQKARKLECQRKRRAENPEKEREYVRKWHADNPGREQENRLKRRAKNPGREQEMNRKWKAKNPEKALEIRNNYVENRTADPELFAINQSERYAVKGVAVRDITANCPEPTRSRLQALIDRIKADPQAGKEVVGLLRTMRELRKAELAEMRASAPDPV